MENIRRQHFQRRPLPTLIAPAEVTREGLAELDRTTQPAQLAADEEQLKLLGLIPPRSSLRSIESSLFQDQVAGFYDPHTGRLALVKNASSADEALGELTLAHELTHALDDQHFGIRDQALGSDDRSLAYTSLVEGDASAVMTRYATQYMAGINLLGVLFAGAAGEGGRPLPPYIQASLEFPYIEGERFVDSLYRDAHSWKLVNFAFRRQPPVSTSQILHPIRYIENRKPHPPRLRVRPLLSPEWRRVSAGSLGEFDTRQLLQRGSDSAHAEQVAAGWHGGSYELWRTGALPDASCTAPCRQRDVLVLAWRTASARDAQDLESGLGGFVAKELGGTARSQGTWGLPGGAAAVTAQGDNVLLVMAPSAGIAAVLAGRSSASGG